MSYAIVIIISAVCFALILLSLGFKPKALRWLTGVMLIAASVTGVIVYGYGYTCQYGLSFFSVVRCVQSVVAMFLNVNSLGAIADTPLMKTQAFRLTAYCAHLLATYATASAVIQALGVRALRLLNLMLIRRGDLTIIYGVNENALSFAGKLSDSRSGAIVFVDSGSPKEYSDVILRMGGVLMDDEDARVPTVRFLRRTGMTRGERKIYIYCLHENAAYNLDYARKLLSVLEERGIKPEQTRLSILLENEQAGKTLQYMQDKGTARYGYGSVFAFENTTLAARMLVHEYPPYKTMTFDETGCVQENFEALIVGFGRTGQAVLRSLVMNGQFVGSNFRATIFSHHYEEAEEGFFYLYPELMSQYDITVIEKNARSKAMYEFLQSNAGTLKYVVICTGSELENTELAALIEEYLTKLGSSPVIVMCSTRGITSMNKYGRKADMKELYDPEILRMENLDRMAAMANWAYENQDSGQDAGISIAQVWTLWNKLSYFNRESNRAFADFMYAFIAASHETAARLTAEGWVLDEETATHLKMMEHKRWCAFHFAMGYRPMSREIFDERVKIWNKVKEQDPSFRISKDTKKRLHACLIEWSKLDELSVYENRWTNGRADYKQNDGVLLSMIPAMLRGEKS